MSQYAEPQLELHMPDEARAFELNLFHFRCQYGYTPALERKDGKFRVQCGSMASNCTLVHVDGTPARFIHTDPTPWLPSSQQAIQHWKLVAALSKP